MPAKKSPSSMACFDCATPDYETGLCDCWCTDNSPSCTNECEICCYSSNLPWCLGAANFEKVTGDASCFDIGKAITLPAVVIYIIFMILNMVVPMLMPATPGQPPPNLQGLGYLCAEIAFAVLAAGYRVKMHQKWGYAESGFMKNCCCLFWCVPCAIAQDALEIKKWQGKMAKEKGIPVAAPCTPQQAV